MALLVLNTESNIFHYGRIVLHIPLRILQVEIFNCASTGTGICLSFFLVA